MERRDHADPYESQNILTYMMQNWWKKEVEAIKDDELTKGRIRSIYVRVNYGHESPKKVAEYYEIPTSVVEDIAKGKLFKSITQDQ